MAIVSTDVNILIIDDERHITDMLVRYFSMEGYNVTGINNPLDAMRIIEEQNFLICILDIQMPGINGLDLLKQIKRYNGMIGVIMITAHATTQNLLTALRRGAETCFLKPLEDLDAVKAAVNGLIERLKGWQNLMKRLKQEESLRGGAL